MAEDDLNRRTFIAAAGAVVAGTLTGCGAGGGLPATDLGSDLGGEGPPVTPTGGDVIDILQEASEADPTLFHLTRANFEVWTGETFELREPGALESVTLESVALELVGVEDRSHEMTPEARDLGLREPFSVRLLASLDTDAPEGRYDVSHPGMGTVTVQVSDGGTTEDSTQPHVGPEQRVYELHFN